MGAPGTNVGKKSVFLKKAMMKAPDFFKRNFVKLLIITSATILTNCSKEETVDKPVRENKVKTFNLTDTSANKLPEKTIESEAQKKVSAVKTNKPKITRINPELESAEDYFRRIDGNTGLTEREKAFLLEWWVLERIRLAECRTREDSLKAKGFVRLDDSVLYNPTTGDWEVLKSNVQAERKTYIERVSERMVGKKIVRQPPEKAVEEDTAFTPRRRDTLYSKNYPPDAYNYHPKPGNDTELWMNLTLEEKQILNQKKRTSAKSKELIRVNDSIYYDPAADTLTNVNLK